MRSEVQDFLMQIGARHSNMLGERYEDFVSDVLHADYENAMMLLLDCVASRAIEADKIIANL